METLLIWLIFATGLLNLMLLIGIAGTLTKLVSWLQSTDAVETMPQAMSNPPQVASNWDGVRPLGRWDGLPKRIES